MWALSICNSDKPEHERRETLLIQRVSKLTNCSSDYGVGNTLFRGPATFSGESATNVRLPIYISGVLLSRSLYRGKGILGDLGNRANVGHSLG